MRKDIIAVGLMVILAQTPVLTFAQNEKAFNRDAAALKAASRFQVNSSASSAETAVDAEKSFIQLVGKTSKKDSDTVAVTVPAKSDASVQESVALLKAGNNELANAASDRAKHTLEGAAGGAVLGAVAGGIYGAATKSTQSFGVGDMCGNTRCTQGQVNRHIGKSIGIGAGIGAGVGALIGALLPTN